MNKQLFQERQKELLWFVNTQAGRHLLSIKDKEPIVKVDPNGVHFLLGLVKKDVALIKTKTFLYEAVAKHFLPFLSYQEILKKDYNLRFKDELEKYKGFLHFENLERNPKLPQIFLATDPFYTGAGDGGVRQQHNVYATAHDAASGNVLDYTSATVDLYPTNALSGGVYYIGRLFLPALTSGLGATADITAGKIFFYPTGVRNVDSDNVRMVQTTQASVSELVLGDFNQCGGVTNPTEGATAVALAAITPNQYNSLTFNATGRGWISKTDWTKIGLRIGRDCTRAAPTGDANDFYPGTRMSEYADTDYDPYLEITYTVPGADEGIHARKANPIQFYGGFDPKSY